MLSTTSGQVQTGLPPAPAAAAQRGEDVVLRVAGLTKRYGERAVVNGLDLEVRRGELFGFLGPNGAGKTTAIAMMLGLVRPLAGSDRNPGTRPDP